MELYCDKPDQSLRPLCSETFVGDHMATTSLICHNIQVTQSEANPYSYPLSDTLLSDPGQVSAYCMYRYIQ